MKTIQLLLIFLLCSFYALLLIAILNPKYSPEYEAYYITKIPKLSPEEIKKFKAK